MRCRLERAQAITEAPVQFKNMHERFRVQKTQRNDGKSHQNDRRTQRNDRMIRITTCTSAPVHYYASLISEAIDKALDKGWVLLMRAAPR